MRRTADEEIDTQSGSACIVETRRIGSLEVSVIGLGCNNFGWKIDERATREVIDASIACGINFSDTADTYGKTKSEEFLGRALVPV